MSISKRRMILGRESEIRLVRGGNEREESYYLDE